MNYSNSFAISATGMDVERLRVEVAALNIANANTVLTADGKGFQPMRVVAQSALGLGPHSSMDAGAFSALVGQGLDPGHARLAAWHARMAQRDSAKATA